MIIQFVNGVNYKGLLSGQFSDFINKLKEHVLLWKSRSSTNEKPIQGTTSGWVWIQNRGI